MLWLERLPFRLTHPIALLGTAFACLMCSGQATTPAGDQNAQGGSSSAGSSAGSPQAGSAGIASAGGGGRTSSPNGVPIACSLDSDCPLPASYCNQTTGQLTYYVNPRCDMMLCSYEFVFAQCGSLTTTAGGLGFGGLGGQAGSSGSGGQGADSGAGGESGADPGGASGN